MATKFKGLQFSLIDEGRFERECDEELQSLMKQLIQYKRKYGKDKAEGAKAVLTVKVSLQFDGRDDADFSIKGTISKQTPARPPSLTVAVEGDEQDGEPTLFVRASGSTDDTPRQSVLSTKDGRVVDLKSGETK
jgi:hypothetical protein